ncbi:MAG: C4-dicarboxylate ABC transporter, partial [Campylobacterota bacterium]|nr:C4-dicarboxylate ABC transporter [Campylobacterota bacterium]
NSHMTSEFHAKNIIALQELESLHVKLEKYPQDVIEAGKKALVEVLQELGAKNSDFKTVSDDVLDYLKLSKEWSKVSLEYFLNVRS